MAKQSNGPFIDWTSITQWTISKRVLDCLLTFEKENWSFFQPAFLSDGNNVAFYEWLPLLLSNAGMDHICPLILGGFFFFTLTVLYIKEVFLKEINFIHFTLVSLMILFSKSHFISYLCTYKIFFHKSYLHAERYQFFSSFSFFACIYYIVLS